MKAPKVVWSYLKPSEMTLMVLGVFFVLAVVTGIAMFRNSEASKFEGKITYEMLSPEQRRQIESIAEDVRVGEGDSNLRFAERVREASSIGLGLSLYLVRERVSHDRVLALNETMSEFSKSDLLPPSCKVIFPQAAADYGLVQTSRAIYYVRYSASPLKLEILSTGYQGLSDGSTFIIRLPDTSAARTAIETSSTKVTTAGAWATIFEAPDDPNHYIPAPFAPVQTFVAMNWRVKPLQQTELSADRVKEIDAFLQARQ